MIKINQLDISSLDVDDYANNIKNIFQSQNTISLGGVFNEEINSVQNDLGEYFKSKAILCSSGTTALLYSIEYGLSQAVDKKITWVISEYIYFSLYSFILTRNEKIIILDASDDEVTLKPVNLSKEEFCIILVTNHNNTFCNLNEIIQSTDKQNRFIIEDCCLVFDNLQKHLSDVQCYSFSNNKLIVAGEGGCVVSNNENFLQWFKWRTFSGIIPTVNNPLFMYMGKYTIEQNAYPFKGSINVMTSILIKKQLKVIDKNIAQRKQNYEFLYNNLQFSDKQPKVQNIALFYPLWLPNKLSSRQLELLQLKCFKAGLQTTLGVLPYYAYKNRNKLYKNILNIPVHPMLTKGDLSVIVTTLKDNI